MRNQPSRPATAKTETPESSQSKNSSDDLRQQVQSLQEELRRLKNNQM